ncbi:MAG: PilZ domain-containing protein [Oxalobacteraceae bacterium]|nr:MAG: PilZ domain-containing protein [Oxalobacteraceae bacterium]
MTDQRQSVRKICKVKALVVMDGQPPVLGRTTDLGAQGISATVGRPMQAGQLGQVGFDLLVEGRTVSLRVRTKVMYSILSGDEYKVGFQFLHLDLNTMTELARFLK